MDFSTYAQNTWCPGCGNFGILTALKQAISSLVKKGVPKENIVVVAGIGCASKIIDYLNLNSFSSLHGRPIVSAEGIKIGNPDLKVIVCAGDGGIYNEGISHLIHAAKRNSDITVLIHDNRNFALTTSQFTATSPEGFNYELKEDNLDSESEALRKIEEWDYNKENVKIPIGIFYRTQRSTFEKAYFLKK